VYAPLEQWYAPEFTFHIRTAGDPKSVVEAVRTRLAAVDPDLPVLDPRTMAEHASAATLVQYAGSTMLGAFGLLVVLLTVVGLYGVLTYSVARRSRELAIRAAIGASPADVVRLVLLDGLKISSAGIGIGCCAALAVAQLLRSQIFGVSPSDPVTFGAIAVLLALLALAASALPALRASRVQPAALMRSDT
jgi:putative ABC transport system permease protein